MFNLNLSLNKLPFGDSNIPKSAEKELGVICWEYLVHQGIKADPTR
jgi:hypothetical protein